MPTFYAGKAAVAKIAAVAHTASSWRMVISTDVVDTSNMTDSGFKSNVSGLSSAVITIAGPYSDTVAITVGNAVEVIVEVVAATGFTVTSARCASCTISTDVNGAAQFEAEFHSNGTITLAV